MKKRVSIGHEFYKTIIEKNIYYVDKTLLVKDIIDNGDMVTLITRPRRFGKTLNLNMLMTFFEDERDRDGQKIDNAHYFDGMKIMDEDEEYLSHMGRHPIIFLTLKSAKQPDFELAYKMLARQIADEYRRHSFVLDSIDNHEKERYRQVMAEKGERGETQDALAFLSKCMYEYYHEKVVILIDEYDVPLENAYFQGFYDPMVGFIRSLFESGLKTNSYLEFSVITGCLRISKESIFTGLNNLNIVSVLSDDFAQYFGFTKQEVTDMLECYGFMHKLAEVEQWYDGYCFGETEIYNPWSIINYVAERCRSKRDLFPKPYWSNTSSNSIVRRLVDGADKEAKIEIENLIAGGTIEKQVHEDITYGEIDRSQDNLWNFLFFTGYLKKVSERFEDESSYMTMTIPNAEIRYVYRNSIREWLERKVKLIDFSSFYKAIFAKDCETMKVMINAFMDDSISYFDSKEAFYHGMMFAMLRSSDNYLVDSNRESGNGRPDIMWRTRVVLTGTVYLFEFKVVKETTELSIGARTALDQIETMHYDAWAKKEGYPNIIRYGIGFCQKECYVVVEERDKGIQMSTLLSL